MNTVVQWNAGDEGDFAALIGSLVLDVEAGPRKVYFWHVQYDYGPGYTNGTRFEVYASDGATSLEEAFTQAEQAAERAAVFYELD